MPRSRRDTAAGIFHIFTHCVWAVPHLYRDSVDRLEFLRTLARVTATTEWTCITYCLMTSHYHLIVAVDDGVLPVAMHRLNLSYALHHNRRYTLRGHVQFERYGSRRLHDSGELLEAFRYVVRNPVEAGLCASPADWRWSSYRSAVGLAEPAGFVDTRPLLAAVDDRGIDPRLALRAYVERA